MGAPGELAGAEAAAIRKQPGPALPASLAVVGSVLFGLKALILGGMGGCGSADNPLYWWGALWVVASSAGAVLALWAAAVVGARSYIHGAQWAVAAAAVGCCAEPVLAVHMVIVGSPRLSWLHALLNVGVLPLLLAALVAYSRSRAKTSGKALPTEGPGSDN